MKKGILKKLAIILMPNILFYVYDLVFSWADYYAVTRYNLILRLTAVLVGNAIIGVFLLLVCLYTIKRRDNSKWPVEYLLGIAIVPLVDGLTYIPTIGQYLLHWDLLWHYPAQYAVVAAIYIGLFVHILRDRRRQLGKRDILSYKS